VLDCRGSAGSKLLEWLRMEIFLVMRKFCVDVMYIVPGCYFVGCDRTRIETQSDPGPGRDGSG
jgi:hypothetical protein